jgi:hypothetical protein
MMELTINLIELKLECLNRYFKELFKIGNVYVGRMGKRIL